MQFFQIVLLSVVSAVVYGILHDQVTARVCVEYFTLGHPPLVPTESPTLLAIAWGIVATWWAGLIVGIPIALCARVGSKPKLVARDLLRPALILLASMAVISLAAGVAGYWIALATRMQLEGTLGASIPRERHWLFLADLCAHQAAYLAGFIGSMVVCVWIFQERSRRSRL